MNASATHISALVLGVVVGTATHLTLGSSRKAEAGESLEISDELRGSKVETISAKQAEELREENQRLKQRLSILESAEGRQDLEVGESTPIEKDRPVEEGTEEALPVHYKDERYAKGLEAVDWKVVGGAMKEMLPQIVELMETWEKEGTPPLELAGKVQQLNGKLIEQLQGLSELPGSGTNGIFTHPLVVANQVDSMLHLSGLTLDDRQRDRLGILSRDFTREDELARISSQEDLALAAILAETKVKDRYYDSVAEMLSPEQRKALYPEGIKDRATLDLFSSSLVWLQYARPLKISGLEDYARKVSRSFRSLELDAANRKKLELLVRNWAKGLAPEVWNQPSDFMAKQGRFKTSRIRLAAEAQLSLMRSILAEIPLSEKDRGNLKQLQRVRVPVLTN